MNKRPTHPRHLSSCSLAISLVSVAEDLPERESQIMPISGIDDAGKRLPKNIFRFHLKPLIEVLAQKATLFQLFVVSSSRRRRVGGDRDPGRIRREVERSAIRWWQFIFDKSIVMFVTFIRGRPFNR